MFKSTIENFLIYLLNRKHKLTPLKTIILLTIMLSINLTNIRSQHQVKVIESYDILERSLDLESDTTYVINFWATWCKPCVQELPYFEQFNLENKNKAVKVILVSLDFAKQIDSHLIPFIEKRKLTSLVVFMADKNYNQWLNKVSPEWSGSIPATLLL
jgi:thiol-disulfide isomerase/thioredoxin